MAKKKKEVVDLKPTNVTDEQLNKLQRIVSNINQAQIEVGRYESGKHTLLHTIQVLQQELKVLQNELQEQYGTVNINIQDGSILHEDGEVNKED
tara:strand:+ start:50 stop:331 length:282 start_codon:yes stop_codon:yes gene_type:complete